MNYAQSQQQPQQDQAFQQFPQMTQPQQFQQYPQTQQMMPVQPQQPYRHLPQVNINNATAMQRVPSYPFQNRSTPVDWSHGVSDFSSGRITPGFLTPGNMTPRTLTPVNSNGPPSSAATNNNGSSIIAGTDAIGPVGSINNNNNNTNNNNINLNMNLHGHTHGHTHSSRPKLTFSYSYGGGSKYGNLSKDRDSPWYQKVRAFEECVSQTLYLSQTPRRKNIKQQLNNTINTNGNDSSANATNPAFWDSISRAMNLYKELLNTPELNSDRVSKLVHLLHNGLRANRNQLTRMHKKPDYDSQSFHKEMTDYLCKSLREISEDVLHNRVQLNEYGAMHLITAFKELLLFKEAVQIWKTAISNSDSYTANIFLNPRVVGVILPILYDNGVSYPEIQSLYEKSSAMINYFHPNLSVGMIRASLSANENDMALKLFQKLCQESTEMKYGYLIETHLSFIGECKDLNIAQAFFDKALNDEMPYKIDLQVSYVKSFLRNVWNQTHDFNHVYQIWYKSSLHYGRNVNHGISSSLNDTFFDIFFEHFANEKETGFKTLQNVIATYSNIKSIDEPFFNIILAKCTIWHDKQILEYIDNSYTIFKIPKTIVAYRILLKSMGSVDDINNAEILQRWIDLVCKSDEIGQKFIANADWAALRDATVTWTQSHRENDKPYQFSQMHFDESRASTMPPSPSVEMTTDPMIQYVDFYSHPAFQALNASGAFDEYVSNDDSSASPVNLNFPSSADNSRRSSPSPFLKHQLIRQQSGLISTSGGSRGEPGRLSAPIKNGSDYINDRLILYLKIVKRYSPYCRDSRQLARLTTGTAVKYSILQDVLNQFQTLDASDIPIPELHSLKPNCV